METYMLTVICFYFFNIRCLFSFITPFLLLTNSASTGLLTEVLITEKGYHDRNK